ncbi:MAG: SAM-dependent chlorinase/fluorinase [Bacteroidota bacterium]|nr:SAM-dependent chlorinase/fluorinase [Bacteroidota bacterium]
MALITLTSDYGWKDHYLAGVKGRFFRELESPQIVDITHDIQPFNLQEAAFVLHRAFPDFPEGSIHIALIDEIPEKGKGLLVALFKGHYFLMADNGLLSLILRDENPDMVLTLDLRNEHLDQPTQQFVRAAAHLYRGGKMELLGRRTEEWVVWNHLNPTIISESRIIKGHVVYVDNYGNLITNIHRAMLRNLGTEANASVTTPRFRKSIPLVSAYSDGRNQGDLLSLFNADGYLEVGVFKSMGFHHNGASSLLGLKVGDEINLNFK